MRWTAQWLAVLMCVGGAHGAGSGPTTRFAPPETPPVSSASADRMGGVRWGYAIDGLRSRVLVPKTRKIIGESVPIVVMLGNEGSGRSPDGSVIVGPVLRVDVWRKGWRKSAFVPVTEFGQSYLRILKGEEFQYVLDLSKVFDLDVPGDYLVIGGYDGRAATRFKEAWKGSRSVESPPYNSVTVVAAADRPASRPDHQRSDRTRLSRDGPWGDTVRGLRCRVTLDAGVYAVGEPIPLTARIENLGTPDDADGKAQLFPFLNLWVVRAGWTKRVSLNLGLPNRLWIKKGEVFLHRLNLAEIVDMIVPGTYAVSVGHENFDVEDIGDWTGRVRSAFMEGIDIR